MSIALLLDGTRPISVKPLLPKMAAVLADLLGVRAVPELVMTQLDEGREVPVATDRMGVDGAPFLLISLAGESDCVGLGGRSDMVVMIYGSRSPLQYALGAAVAIAFAREFGGGIWDDRRFFSEEVHTSPEVLLERMRVTGPNDDHRGAANKITWGPAGGP